MRKSPSFVVSALFVGATIFSSCADRHDTAQTDLDLVGSWSGVFNEVGALSVGENHIFVADNERAGFTLFSLADEAAPSPLGGATELEGLYAPGDADYLSSYLLDDHFLFLKLATNLLVFDVSDLSQPRYLRNFFASGVNHVTVVSEMAGDSDGGERLFHYLYYSDRSDGLSLHAFPDDTTGLSLEAPERWFQEGGNPSGDLVDTFVDYENDGNDLVVVDDYLYLANGRFGLAIFRIQSPRMPLQLEEVATLRLPGDALRLSVEDGLAAVTLGGEGLAVVDVLDPSRPYLKSILEPGGSTFDVELRQQHAYIANSSKGVLVADLTTPESPKVSYQFENGYARRLKVAQGRIFVADRELGLLILDDPLN
jgi:hypothetical protein